MPIKMIVIYYKEHAQHLNVQIVEFQDGRLKERVPMDLLKRFHRRSYVTFLLHPDFKSYSCHPKLLHILDGTLIMCERWAIKTSNRL